MEKRCEKFFAAKFVQCFSFLLFCYFGALVNDIFDSIFTNIQDQIIYTRTNSTTTMDKEAPKFNNTDVFRVRKDSRLNNALFLCKLILKKHDTVQIEGMGECISLVTKISQLLSKDKLATITKITSEDVHRENSRGINPKLSIKLTKTAQFDDLTKNIVLKQ